MRINGICLAFLALFVATSLHGQRFGARAVAGLNFSQIGGDLLAGFDKVGLVAGLKGTANVANKVDINLDFLYSQRGSATSIFNSSVDPDISINLNYLDLPVYVTYSDWYDEEQGYYKAYASGGFSYGRLMSSSVVDNFNEEDQNYENLQQYFEENDFSWMLGFGFRLSRRFGLDFRYTRSITLLLDAEKHDLETASLRPYFISVRTEFIF